jgi:WD40 repeat protein
VTNKIYLLDLQEVNLISLDIPDTFVFWVSFSPDNQSAIVTGYDGLDGQDKFYLIDTTTGDYELLPIQTGFGSVAWNPDGSKIAILDLSIFPSELNTSTRIRVFDVQTGDEIRKFISKEIPQGAPNLEVLVDGWTADFHTQLQDISHCAAPP